MPFWVWLAFKDAPTGGQLIGGAIVLTAVVADIIGDLRSQACFVCSADRRGLLRRPIGPKRVLMPQPLSSACRIAISIGE